ncbi:hypothetical protein ACFW2Y_32135 [Streptomyces sp. NPDC058877]|uniref:hypothetical protein n=1 Tax=Streptomyces sp. NPDC058877 TaxID=3346665 RepID=UPI0036CED980
MSAPDERPALAPPIALYDHVQRLLRESSDAVPPPRGYPLPRKPGPRTDPFSWEAAEHAVQKALDPLPEDPDTLRRRFEELGVQHHHRHLVRTAVAALELPAEQLAAARSLGRGLARRGTTVPTVAAGIALLRRLGEPEDVPCLSALGLFRDLAGPAVHALDALDRRAAALVHLVARGRRDELRPLIRALWKDDRQAVYTELVALPAALRSVGGSAARRIAEASRLSELLDHRPSDAVLLARTGELLVRMGSSHDDPGELLGHRDALRLYDTVITRARLLPPTLDNAALLLSLALDLSSGAGALLDWPPGRRAVLLDLLGQLLAMPPWAEASAGGETADQRQRAGWIRRTGRRPFQHPAPAAAFRVEVVAGDPADRNPVEARVLIDGRPVVPALFGRGPAHSPDHLLDDGRLRAGAEAREVQLAEASCSEGCCGALHVTIRRDGDHVVWENWRRTPSGCWGPTAEPPAHRFDAAVYDAELTRAETDGSWSWRARTVARLIKAGLVGDPGLLDRWDAKRGWISSGFDDPDTAVVTFWYAPGLASGRPERAGEPLQFRWDVPDDGTPAEAQAAAVLHRLASEDPKSHARVCGGSRARAEELGFPLE